ncbi:MAG: AAA family ATPase, partial [Terriglobales bacterium]
MRFESVTAHAFGPMVGDTIRLAPGMTVIHGPNESGKSTWHAALYAGLCGVRRSRGRPHSQDQDFADRHKPWDADDWEVSVCIVLDDGRRIELRHDLEGRADCRATDLTLGRDVTGEIINDGAPDGALWLGLDRASFLATACVQQADILAILDDPGMLQQHLQRAASTARADATAAAAIERLKEFQRTHVGQHWVESRPLGGATAHEREAEAQLVRARREHAEFLQLAAEAQEAVAAAERLRARLGTMEAAVARRDAEQWAARAARVAALAARYPAGPPTSLVEDDELARTVAAAVAAWETRPRVSEPLGETAAQLRQRIAELPAMPDGDRQPDESVVTAQDAYPICAQRVAFHAAQRPPEPTIANTGGATAEELRELARDLDAVEPALDPALAERLAQARRRKEEIEARSGIQPLVVVGVLGCAAAALAAAVTGGLIGLLILVATGIAVVGLVAWRNAVRARTIDELRAAENAAGESRHTIDNVIGRKQAARTRVEALGLPVTGEALRAAADRVEVGEQQRQQLERWTDLQRQLSNELRGAAQGLGAALERRGVTVNGDPVAVAAAYVSACGERGRVAALAGQRGDLETQLVAREAAEEAWRRVTEAEGVVRRIAAQCQIAGDAPDALVDGLHRWQVERAAALQQDEAARDEWRELQTLLGGQSPSEIEAEAAREADLAAKLSEGLDPAAISDLLAEPDLDVRLTDLRREVDNAAQAAANRSGQVKDRAGRLPSVAEAEEAAARAEQELARVRQLERILELTRGFLEHAQEHVHRTIAPVVAGTIAQRLPEVTQGRYVEAIVDPETLDIRVRDAQGRLREAVLLSQGTAEQIYLLLRMALAQHLTKPDETCPLILDEAT